MDIAIDFIQSFIQAEYKALMTTYTEPDENLFDEAIRQSEDFLYIAPNHIMSLGFGRPPGLSSDEIEEMAEEASKFNPRVLFLAKHYEHPVFGDLYVFYASGYHDMPLLAYDTTFYVALVEKKLKIISKYVVGFNSGIDELEWEYLCGTKVDQLGDLIEVRKFIEPESRPHKADYNNL